MCFKIRDEKIVGVDIVKNFSVWEEPNVNLNSHLIPLSIRVSLFSLFPGQRDERLKCNKHKCFSIDVP